MSFFAIFSLILLLPIFSRAETLPGCPNKCSEVEISYPFGIGNGCFLPGFEIICNRTGAYLAQSDIQLLQISDSEIRVNATSFITTYCNSMNSYRSSNAIILPEGSPYTISVKSNKFTAIGCGTMAWIEGDHRMEIECISQCFTAESIVYGKCNGTGCCQTPIPSQSKNFSIFISDKLFEGPTSSLIPCSYAFVIEDKSFNFSETDYSNFNGTADIAMMLEWSIGNETCSKANQSDSYVCRNNSSCLESCGGSGYVCSCSPGYQGNPYLNGSSGCQDIDECSVLLESPCVRGARCRNKVPGFKCICPVGSSGDGRVKDGTGCTKIFPVIQVVVGVGLILLLLATGFTWLYWALKKRKQINLKKNYFHENGGLLLQKQIASREGSVEAARIFTAQELEKATNNYDESQILGKGGFGTVYKGMLEDSRVVAIKKAKMVASSQIEQFINEVVILTQINHRNVVKLLGCCLETQVPMLVYEFIPNGTLSDHIHEKGTANRLSWGCRLRIAVEIAEALAYLHSSSSMPIFHRDVKSSNILLDEHFIAKVADFGASRLVPTDRNQITTLVQGTLGYLDPEYFQTSQLTEKSDVYSFGVVLVELLTGEKPISLERSQQGTNLAMHFISSMKSKQLIDILEFNIVNEGSIDQFHAVANLAKKCLRLKGEKRPTMKKAAQELSSIKGSNQEKKRDEMVRSPNEQPYEFGDWVGNDYLQRESISIEMEK